MKANIGFPTIDRITNGGLAKGNLLSINAKAGMGKTGISSQIAINLARQGLRVGYVDPETNNQILSNRWCKAIHGFEISKLPDSNHEFCKLFPKYLKTFTFKDNNLRSILGSVTRISVIDKISEIDVLVLDNINLMTDNSWFYMHYLKKFISTENNNLIGIVTSSIERPGIITASTIQQANYIQQHSDIVINLTESRFKAEVINNLYNGNSCLGRFKQIEFDWDSNLQIYESKDSIEANKQYDDCK